MKLKCSTWNYFDALLQLLELFLSIELILRDPEGPLDYAIHCRLRLYPRSEDEAPLNPIFQFQLLIVCVGLVNDWDQPAGEAQRSGNLIGRLVYSTKQS